MPFKTKPTVDQLNIPTSPEVGELIVLASVGGNPALPAIDGSNLTGITPSIDTAMINDNTGTLIIDDNTGCLVVDS